MRIGVDFGGTKIEAAALTNDAACTVRIRTDTPATYDAAVGAVADLVADVERQSAKVTRIGVGVPGSVSPKTGMIRNANALYLNGRRFREDLELATGKAVRLSNDANCLALSEAIDGAGKGAAIVFALVLGTGCGGGLAVHGRIIEGANGIAGEWGHNPLPWPTAAEWPAPECWCGKRGCLEVWISGTGFRRDYESLGGKNASGQEIVSAARAGDPVAAASFGAYIDRLGRALANVANLLDPDVFVFGGGMSNVSELYDRLPAIVRAHVFSDHWNARLQPAEWGDSSGVRGAARLAAR